MAGADSTTAVATLMSDRDVRNGCGCGGKEESDRNRRLHVRCLLFGYKKGLSEIVTTILRVNAIARTPGPAIGYYSYAPKSRHCIKREGFGESVRLTSGSEQRSGIDIIDMVVRKLGF